MSQLNTSTDTQLVIDYKEGNLKVLPYLVERWHKKFCDKAYWVTKNADASKDIAQETWKTVITKIEQLHDVNKFGVWSLRIVYSKSFDWLRHKQQQRSRLQDYQQIQLIMDSETIDDYEAKRIKLMEAIKLLSIEQQNVIRLFYLEDYSLKEMSKILHISTGTVKSRLFHAREKLKTLLK